MPGLVGLEYRVTPTDGDDYLALLQPVDLLHPFPVVQPAPPVFDGQRSLVLPFSSNGVAVAQNVVLLAITDITPYTYFVIQNTSGFALLFQISLDGVTYQTVAMDALGTPGTWVTTLATATTYTRGVKGVAAQILAGTAASNIYAASSIQLAAGVGAP